MRVLYLSPFQAYGGATRSLVEVMSALDPADVEMHAVTAAGVREKGWFPSNVAITEVRGLAQWDNTRFSRYRGLRWLLLLREISNLPSTYRVIRRLASEPAFDLIHCNEITLLPSAVLVKRALKVPLVVHVRSLQAAERAPRRTRFITRLMREHADAVIAIDQAVARTLDPDLSVDLIYNSMAVPDDIHAVAEHDKPLVFGIIGSLSASKAVVETVEACIELKRRGVPFRLLIAGENVRKISGIRGRLLEAAGFAHDVEQTVADMIADHDLHDQVQMLGFVSDSDSLYAKLDVLCFPSRLDAPGRPVFEAALHSVPAIVAMRNPTEDVIENHVTGVLIDHPDPVEIADAMEMMHRQRARTREMGQAARVKAEQRFDSTIAGAQLKALYERVIARAGHTSQRRQARSRA